MPEVLLLHVVSVGDPIGGHVPHEIPQLSIPQLRVDEQAVVGVQHEAVVLFHSWPVGQEVHIYPVGQEPPGMEPGM